MGKKRFLKYIVVVLFALFLMPSTIKAAESDNCNLLNIETSGKLKSYPSNEEISFSLDDRIYLLQISEDETFFQVKEVSEGAKYTINGQEKDVVDVKIEDFLTKVSVETNDGAEKKNYYFIYQDAEGNIPLLSEPSENQKTKAKSMLSSWYNRNDAQRLNMMKNAYWAVFESAATGIDMNGGYVFDPQENTYNQATDWSRAIIQTVILGYNPYDFGENHMNLVEGLLKLKNESGLFGGYANNEWALMALKVVGEEIPDGLIQYEKTNGFYNTYSVDIRGWALAASKNIVDDKSLLIGTLDLKDSQNEDGLWGNQYTNGCILTGIVGAGVNLDYFSVDGKSLLDIIAAK